ncbi:hypothetical protein [Streptomyces sp. H27-D2]|uniref:hypothetical protein n=1 Tax=Streptomyces sp. H27-D2 TaxID=3046304 RepID=UPI002DBC220B|nr:hypothetical protein [Streptomyces sp. H27-D2]MEC4020979.1 hypothetical protein [Streptomyces sp. H27-D2]
MSRNDFAPFGAPSAAPRRSARFAAVAAAVASVEAAPAAAGRRPLKPVSGRLSAPPSPLPRAAVGRPGRIVVRPSGPREFLAVPGSPPR